MKNTLPVIKVFQIDSVKAGKRIRVLRTRAGMSLRKLAHDMGFSAPFISDLEHGRRNWTEKNYNNALSAIADFQ